MVDELQQGLQVSLEMFPARYGSCVHRLSHLRNARCRERPLSVVKAQARRVSLDSEVIQQAMRLALRLRDIVLVAQFAEGVVGQYGAPVLHQPAVTQVLVAELAEIIALFTAKTEWQCETGKTGIERIAQRGCRGSLCHNCRYCCIDVQLWPQSGFI